MKITATDEYMSHKAIGGCSYMEDCQRMFCLAHRALWRSCETAIKTSDGAGETWYETQDCISCMAEMRLKRAV